MAAREVTAGVSGDRSGVPATGGRAPRFLPAGDGALVVEFGDGIDEASNRAVLALDAALARHPVEGVVETVPTYRSLLVQFDPLRLTGASLRGRLEALLPEVPTEAPAGTGWRVPVCYGGPHGEDLDAVAARHGLSAAEVAALHAGAEYRVYMIGFAPGYVYLGGLPERIHTDRRPDPRMRTPGRSVAIGGRQASISPPIEMPSGWHLVGRTPVRTYDPGRGDRPFLFAPGDRIRFVPIGPRAFDDLCRAADAGEPVAEREAGP